MDDETKRKAFALRQQGKSWAEIGGMLHYDASVVRKAVTATTTRKRKERSHDRLG